MLLVLNAGLHLSAPVEVGVDIEVKDEGLLAAPLVLRVDADVEVGLGGGELLGVETAVGTETDAVLLKVGSLELDAAALAEAEDGHPLSEPSLLPVDLVLLLGVGGAEGRIERSGDGGLADAIGLLVDQVVAARLGLAARRRRRGNVVLLVVSVGSDNDDLEASLVLAVVGGRLLGNILTPESALEAGDRVSLLARALFRVPLGVTLDEDVEASAGIGLVALLGAGKRIVAGEFEVSKVSAAGDGGAQVGERLVPARRSLGRGGHLVVNGVVLESIDGIGNSGRSVGVGLSSARVERVDESTVGADLDLSSTGWVSSEGPGVDPVDWGARRGSKVGRRLAGSRQSITRSRRLGGRRATWWWVATSGRRRSRLSTTSVDRVGRRCWVVAVLLGLGLVVGLSSSRVEPVPPTEGRRASLDIPLGCLSSRRLGAGISGNRESFLLVVCADLGNNTHLGALGNIVDDVFRCIEALGSRRGRYKGGGRHKKVVRTHSE